MVRRVYILTAEIAIKIFTTSGFFKVGFLRLWGTKKFHKWAGWIIKVCFLEVETFFPVLVAKLISKFRISPGFLNQHSKKPFLPFFSEVANFFQKLQI